MTTQTRNDLAAEHYEWAQRLLMKKYGAEAEAFAGISLLTAIDQWDGEGDFREYAAGVLVNSAKSEWSRENGRKGSRKREAIREDISSHEPVYIQAATEYDEGIDAIDPLIQFEQLDGLKRIIAICKYLGGFDDRDTAHILNRRSLRVV